MPSKSKLAFRFDTAANYVALVLVMLHKFWKILSEKHVMIGHDNAFI